MRRFWTVLACLALLVVGLALRLPGLDRLLTPDEGDWGRNTAQFTTALLQHNWAGTLTVPYPGVTTTWAGTLGLAARSWLSPLPGAAGLAGLAQALARQPNRMDLIPWLRLPVILACVLGTLAFFFLARRLLGDATAALAAGLLALDPFFLAHSRLIQTDALLTTFLTLAWLAVLAAGQTQQRRYYLIGGLALAAAVLTKSPALALGPPIVAWLAWHSWRRAAAPGGAGQPWRAAGRGLVWFGVPAIAAIWLCWPALWVAPAAVFGRVWGLMAAFSQTGHELGNFWLNQPVARPGPLFYPAVILWRTTPVTLLGLLLALAFSVWRLAAGRIPAGDASGRPAFGFPAALPVTGGLWLYVAWFTLMMALGDKQFDRYLLPVFPILDLLAAWGWLACGAALLRLLPRRDGGPRPFAASAAAVLLLAGQALSALPARPDFLSVYNPLAGGIGAARQVMLVGWGEGLGEAATFLNQQPGATVGHAGAWYGQNVFGAFYHGQSYDLYYDAATAAGLYARDTDYVVTYVNQEQRLLLDASVRERLGAPIFTSQAGPVVLAQVYRWPKPYAHTADRLLAPGLRLLGWEAGPAEAARAVTLTLYWDERELAAQSAGPGVRAWLKDQTGEVWSTAQAPVVAGAGSAQAGWLDRTARGQALALPLPAGLPEGTYRLEAAALAGQGVALGDVAVPATRLADVAGAAADWQPIAAEVVFDGSVRLAGYRLDRERDQLRLDLLWAPRQAPIAPSQFFVHVVDTDEKIAAQADGGLILAGPGAAAWRPGDLVRQRVVLSVPPAATGSVYRIYLGLYHLDGGARLPLAVAAARVADGRYLLATTP